MDDMPLKDQFKYYAYKALHALKKGDRETYLTNLKIASGILREIKEEKKKNDDKTENKDDKNIKR